MCADALITSQSSSELWGEYKDQMAIMTQEIYRQLKLNMSHMQLVINPFVINNHFFYIP